ncbi:MAG: hypothetical protein ACOCYW_10025, partial [Roseicyclus sp.]
VQARTGPLSTDGTGLSSVSASELDGLAKAESTTSAAALRAALQSMSDAPVSGDFRVSVVETDDSGNGVSWSVVDEATGQRWFLEKTSSGAIAAKRATINAVAAAVAASAAAGFAGVALSGAGATAENTVGGETKARIAGRKSDGIVTTQGTIRVASTSHAQIDAGVLTAAISAAGGAVGVGAAIGAAISRNVIGEGGGETLALVENAQIRSAASALEIEALSDRGIRSVVFSGAAAAAGGAVGVSLSGAGVGSFNAIGGATRAEIRGAASDIDVARIAIHAQDGSDIRANANAVALSLAVGAVAFSGSIAATEARNTITAETTAGIVRGTTTGSNGVVKTGLGDVSVTAKDQMLIDAQSAAVALTASGGALAASLSGAGAGSVNAIKSRTVAEIVGMTVTSAGSVTVDADGNATIEADIISAAASLAVGAGAIGASIGASSSKNEIGGVRADGRKSGVFARIEDADVTAGGQPLTLQSEFKRLARGSYALGSDNKLYQYFGPDGGRVDVSALDPATDPDWDLVRTFDQALQEFQNGTAVSAPGSGGVSLAPVKPQLVTGTIIQRDGKWYRYEQPSASEAIEANPANWEQLSDADNQLPAAGQALDRGQRAKLGGTWYQYIGEALTIAPDYSAGVQAVQNGGWRDIRTPILVDDGDVLDSTAGGFSGGTVDFGKYLRVAIDGAERHFRYMGKFGVAPEEIAPAQVNAAFLESAKYQGAEWIDVSEDVVLASRLRTPVIVDMAQIVDASAADEDYSATISSGEVLRADVGGSTRSFRYLGTSDKLIDTEFLGDEDYPSAEWADIIQDILITDRAAPNSGKATSLTVAPGEILARTVDGDEVFFANATGNSVE